ncbi:YbhB/YbcL family Raf kinase inhibitor-like protein [Actinospica durhamensis]|uniref:YbhB/YbcL family Raf kinase inhibitor-like protein n=1 Tax=Actinospica durhamensis TaxID=1508375 RepID=A0A941EMR5_9ACTN|nr:YbhB/YbcL family Raf kinase inhibitor-like protein [Actinospica durhamensis]MBR7834542.1 YbhB/YbcL family Raf kinase inhibitor-like protein [Actinospica durhamensis]
MTSTAFQQNGVIPKAYTCDATNGAVSPPLAWSAVPPGTGWIALYVYDNTGSVLHWIVLNIKPDVTSMAAGSNAGGLEIQGYLPMCPGTGNTDQYQWTLYAEPNSWHPPKIGASYGVDPGQLAAHALGIGSLSGIYAE